MEEGLRKKTGNGRSVGLGLLPSKNQRRNRRQKITDAEREHKEMSSTFCHDIGKAASYQGSKIGLEALRAV